MYFHFSKMSLFPWKIRNKCSYLQTTLEKAPFQEGEWLLVLHSLGILSVQKLCSSTLLILLYLQFLCVSLFGSSTEQGLFNPTQDLRSNECQLSYCHGRKPPSIQDQSVSQPELGDQPASCCFSRPHMHLGPRQVSALMQLYIRALRPISPVTIHISTIPGYHGK